MTAFDLRAPAPDSPDVLPVPGRPRVFALEGHARPVADADVRDPDGEIDVSLLMTPVFDEPFSMRGPRGSFGQGQLFIVRCAGLGSLGALARTLAVKELVGIHFDLVTAELVRPGDCATAATRPATRGGRRRDASADRPAAEREATARRHELQRRGSATAIEVDGITTIQGEVRTTLLTAVRADEPIVLRALRGEIPRGACFALRFFDTSGARRALIRAELVRQLPGMLDEVTGTLLRPTTPAPERQYFRAPFTQIFAAEVAGKHARTIRGCMIDLSADGVGFRTTTRLAPGDRLQLTDPALADLDGAALTVVRVDPRDSQRYGARFLDAERGALTLATVLGLRQSERETRRRNQVEAARLGRRATATSLTAAEADRLRNRRMGTRRP